MWAQPNMQRTVTLFIPTHMDHVNYDIALLARKYNHGITIGGYLQQVELASRITDPTKWSQNPTIAD